MYGIYAKIFQALDFRILFLSILLFFVGYGLAPTAYYKKIKWLTAYPFFIMGLMDRYFKFNWPPLKIFLVILILNSCSLFFNLISAWGIITPFLFVIYLGINIGVVIYHSFQGQFYYVGLINPVTFFELPAACISITMAIQFSLKNFFHTPFLPEIPFTIYIIYFLLSVLPLLTIAGIIETYLIIRARNNDQI